MNDRGRGRFNQPHSLANKLFKTILDQQQLKSCRSMPPGELLAMCRQAGTLFHRKVQKKPVQIIKFLSNYHHIILSYSAHTHSPILNNISLHFIILSSYAMIAKGDKHMAKQMLKKAIPYLASTDPDPALLCTAICNLCALRIEKGKYYKCIPLLIRLLQILREHINVLKHKKNKPQVLQDTVLEINTYLVLSKCSRAIIKQNKNSFYKELLAHASHTGIKKCIKYLGRESLFTKKFEELITGVDLDLPFYRKKLEESQEKDDYQQRIMEQLKNIEELLKNKKQQAPVVYIKEQKKEEPPPPPPHPPSPPPPPPPDQIKIDPKKIILKSSFMVGDWRIDAQIAKEPNQKIGTVILDCKKGKDYVSLVLIQNRFLKLLSQMNVVDILPYECSIDSLTPEEIIRYCIMQFLFVDDNKNIEIFPRATSLLPPLRIEFLKNQCFIFTYHIRCNNFRLAIAPKNTAETYYLDLDLNQNIYQDFVEVVDETEDRMERVFCDVMQANQSKKRMPLNQMKKVSIIDEMGFVNYITDILEMFQTFLNEHMSELGQAEIFNKKKQFFKFVQSSKKRQEGIFYYVRYLPHIKGYEVYVSATHESYNPEGKSKAKGNTLYSHQHFYRDFGISEHIHQIWQFRCLAEIISKKYGLKVYELPLATKDAEIYQENSITEKKIAHKTFFRRMREHNKQMLPLTACLINLNNQYPVGIKLTGFNPVTCSETAFFIHVYPEVWKWPFEKQEPLQDPIMHVVEQYGYKKDYFLVEWLLRFGFRKILSFIEISRDGEFYIREQETLIDRMAKIIDKIDHQN